MTTNSATLLPESLQLRARAELERRRRARLSQFEEWRGDPLAFARAAHFEPDPWQVTILQSTAQAILLNCSRQTGKSTIIALLACRELLNDDAMVVIVSPSERQSKELMRKVYRFWRQLGRPIAARAAAKTTLELENGARLEAFPASSETVVGVSAVTLLVADEAARVPDDLYHSMSPMLAVSAGRLMAPSTPRGKRGWWYDLWKMKPEDDPTIERVEIKATECPRIPPAFLERERRRAGEFWFAQEFMCQFLDQTNQIFPTALVEAAMEDMPAFWTE